MQSITTLQKVVKPTVKEETPFKGPAALGTQNGAEEWLKANAEIVTVTPTMAEEWLKANVENNRNQRLRDITKYSRDMMNGDWSWTAEPIRFNQDGHLVDGQHRLMAIIKANVCMPFLIVYGLDIDAIRDFDTGIKRGFNDALKMKGHSDPSTRASLVTHLYVWEQWKKSNRATRPIFKSSNASQAEKSNIDKKYEISINELLPKARLVSDKCRTTTAVIGLAWILFRELDVEKADLFMDALKEGTDLKNGNPILVLRDRFIDLKVDKQINKKGTIPNEIPLALMIKAWNKWRVGSTISKITWDPSREQYPLPI